MPHMSFRFSSLAALVLSLAACNTPVTGAGPNPAAASPAPSAAGASPSPAAVASLTPSATPSAPAAKPDKALAEACEHMTEGPAKAVNASLTASGRGEVAADHHRYDVSLAKDAARFAGSVVFNSKRAGDLTLALGFEGKAGDALPLTLYQDGKALTFESSDTSKAHATCPAIKHVHVAEVGVGPVELRFGAGSVAKVSLVLEVSEGHAHEDDHAHD